MSEKEIKKGKDQEKFESEQNLVGVFSILFDVAKRTNPEKYLDGYKENKNG